MSKESYARGFCKAAAAAGVDPVALAKYAGEAGPDTDAGIGYRAEEQKKMLLQMQNTMVRNGAPRQMNIA